MEVVRFYEESDVGSDVRNGGRGLGDGADVVIAG
jgi:hypothetical protein